MAPPLTIATIVSGPVALQEVLYDVAAREGDAEKMRRGLRGLEVRARRAATR